MSLRYVIDAYNLTNHSFFNPKTKHDSNLPQTLLSFIKTNKLTTSSKNSIILVFDGFPRPEWIKSSGGNTEFIFSRKASADEKIKRLVEESAQRKNIIVVSNDRELKFIVRSLGGCCQSIEEFFGIKKEASSANRINSEAADELSYSEKHKINQELSKIWLK